MKKGNKGFKIELCTVAIILTVAILWVGKDFFFASNNLYLHTTDALPHYTKIEYLAKMLSSLKVPSWYPYWYNGSTVTQYYPPLSFLLIVPLEMIFHNPTISFKIYIFLSLFIGSIGIWFICYKHLGRYVGVLASIFYAVQPYFLISLLGWGVIAQAPILALAPWHLIISIYYYKKPSLKTWLLCLLLMVLLLLSHIMHGFMIALSIFVVMLAVSIARKKGIGTTLMWGISAGLAAGLIGFWWVPGVLPLENPGVPYLLPDSAASVTANFTWFIPWKNNVIAAHFSGTLILVAIFSLYFIYKDKSKARFLLCFTYALTVFTFIFSFGSNLPLFKYLPLASSLVPGRIITETAIGASILSAYLLKKIFKSFKLKIVAYLLLFTCMLPIAAEYGWLMNNRIHIDTSDSRSIKEVIAAIPAEGTSFQNGRFDWLAPADSMYTYFPQKYNINIVQGWNIEGTPHNHFIWFRNSVLSEGKYDYIIKKMNDMNVRSMYVGYEYKGFYDRLKQEGFNDLGDFSIGKLLYNNKPSSYFYRMQRDVIVIGKAARTFQMNFPWPVEGKSVNIEDYKLEDFKDYKMIIFDEPGIKSINEEKYFEELIAALAKQNKTVIIEMGRGEFPSSVLGVSLLHYSGIKDGRLVKYNEEADSKEFYLDSNEEVIGLKGLDESYYSLKASSLSRPLSLIGAKNINGTKVYFIGGPLTMLLSPTLEYLTGFKLQGFEYKQRDEVVISALEDVFSKQPHYTALDLPDFETQNTEWNHKGCSFEYNSETDENVMVSVTYTPRWKVKVDGKSIEVKSVDNMINVKLPSGSHKVVMSYGITWVGMLGWFVTILSVLLTIFAARYGDRIMKLSDNLYVKLLVYLQVRKQEV